MAALGIDRFSPRAATQKPLWKALASKIGDLAKDTREVKQVAVLPQFLCFFTLIYG